MERIAAEAGVTRGAIYWHFANKRELLGAIIQRVHGLHDAIVAPVFEDAGLPLQRVLDWALEVIDVFATDERTRKVHKIIVTRCEYVGEMQDARVYQQEVHDSMEANFYRVFEAAAANGHLGRGWDAKSAATVLKYFMSGMLDNWMRYEFNVDRAETMKAALRCLMASFGADCLVLSTPQAERAVVHN